MKTKMISVDLLASDPANVRTHSEKNLKAIMGSLQRFGQQKPIVIDEANVVRAGNGTLEAARRLGWEKIAVVLSALSDAEATAYAIADNRTAELADWDEPALTEMLASLAEQSDDLLLSTGFDDSDLANMLKKFETDESPEDFAEFNEDIETEYECPKCNYRWSGKRTTATDGQ